MSALDRIGRTPLARFDGVFVKLECSNPSGSVKDRVAKFLLQEAARRGELKPGDTVVEATSGNTGIAMSLAAHELGYRAIIYMPEHMSEERVRYIRAFGAEVRLTPKEGGFELPIEERDRFRDRPGYFVPDQFGNPDNVRCHRETTGAELIEQLRDAGVARLDAFVAGVGTGGTLMGVGQALRAVQPAVRLVAVEPLESAVMSGGEAGPHDIQGIGDGFIPGLVDMGSVDEVAVIATEDAKAECERIRREHGHCVGVSAGANMLAARERADRGLVVATVWPDCSDRYGSMGLAPPQAEGSTCPLRETCASRSRDLLGA
jgi:cysteine synthase A